MANTALSLAALSQIALSAGIDIGFNAVEVETWYELSTDKHRLVFKFGDREEMRRPRMRTPCEWGLSYTEDAECTRERRIVEMPHSVIYEDSNDLKRQLTEKLLELAPAVGEI